LHSLDRDSLKRAGDIRTLATPPQRNQRNQQHDAGSGRKPNPITSIHEKYII
jgi:hypothetical protein